MHFLTLITCLFFLRYLGILQNLFEKIFESLTGADAEDREEGEAQSEKQMTEKYKEKFNEIGKSCNYKRNLNLLRIIILNVFYLLSQ